MSTSVLVWKPLSSMIRRTTKTTFRPDCFFRPGLTDLTRRNWLLRLLKKWWCQRHLKYSSRVHRNLQIVSRKQSQQVRSGRCLRPSLRSTHIWSYRTIGFLGFLVSSLDTAALFGASAAVLLLVSLMASVFSVMGSELEVSMGEIQGGRNVSSVKVMMGASRQRCLFVHSHVNPNSGPQTTWSGAWRGEAGGRQPVLEHARRCWRISYPLPRI